jgi:hypothetical protein
MHADQVLRAIPRWLSRIGNMVGHMIGRHGWGLWLDAMFTAAVGMFSRSQRTFARVFLSEFWTETMSFLGAWVFIGLRDNLRKRRREFA